MSGVIAARILSECYDMKIIFHLKIEEYRLKVKGILKWVSFFRGVVPLGRVGGVSSSITSSHVIIGIELSEL
jgi:hypothetical protein